MSHTDKRSAHTDALETLGMIHFKPEARDAIHLAVEPVKAAVDLKVGEKVSIVDDIAYPLDFGFVNGKRLTYHGIVDPFLPFGPKKDESFWFVMAPRMITSLRHVWEHPDFKEKV